MGSDPGPRWGIRLQSPDPRYRLVTRALVAMVRLGPFGKSGIRRCFAC